MRENNLCRRSRVVRYLLLEKGNFCGKQLFLTLLFTLALYKPFQTGCGTSPFSSPSSSTTTEYKDKGKGEKEKPNHSFQSRKETLPFIFVLVILLLIIFIILEYSIIQRYLQILTCYGLFQNYVILIERGGEIHIANT